MDLCIVKSNKKVTEVTLINYPNIKHIAAIANKTFERIYLIFSLSIIVLHLSFMKFFFLVLKTKKVPKHLLCLYYNPGLAK